MVPRREDFTLVHTFRVRWAEVDRQGVVFNANYLLYFDVALTEYWRAAGVAYPDGYVDRFDSDMLAARASAEFHAPARYDEMMDVACRAVRIGRSSMQFVLGIWRNGTLLTSGELVYVNTNIRSGRSVPWPEELRAAVLRFERVQPDLSAG